MCVYFHLWGKYVKGENMELDYYLFKNKITQVTLARALGLDRARVSMYVNKKVNPSLLTAVLIEEWTGGQVTCKELLRLKDRL